MKFNLKRILILFISLFVIGSVAIETSVHTVSGDSLHLKDYTNEIQNLNEPYKFIKPDYFKPITHLSFTNKPVTRYYQLTLKKVKMSPDGFERTVWSVNGQHPGPLIQANKGDRLVINVTNHFDDPATVHWHGMFQHGTNWYDGVPGQVNSPLISGLGRYNCTAAPPGSKCKSNQPLAVYNVKKNKKYRFRIINSSADGVFVFSIDQHKLKVIEADGIYLKPTIIKKLPVAVGQRYSVIVDANQPVGNYFIRGTLDKRCTPINNATINFNSAIDWNGLGILHYEGAINKPNSKEFDDDFTPCRDLDKKHLNPIKPITKYDGHVTDFVNITITFGRDKNQRLKALINNSSFVPQMNDPTVNKITRDIDAKDLPKEQNSVIFNHNGGIAEIYVKNNNGADHPFHMHGHVFAIMYVGEKGEVHDKSKYNKRNPVVRDTLTIPGNGFVVIRFITDNPGVWAFHCHIEWHVELGMVLGIIELQDTLKKETIPEDVVALCLEHDLQKRTTRKMLNSIVINEIRSYD
ncbi:Cu-oxidase-domain-containing protein [Rhizophagus irregularis]|uniref:Cu-oxidase-domain-containing protein n=1 Tax=Rhizophagus irregularis TaxID=588596 RepID=A0A2N1MRM1_9GLOM|nr:Cu-oxidase-domain-containing protein [Rhizophagus irregularis]